MDIGDNKSIVKNSTMLLLMNIAKMVFPFITLPYLTRVLSTDCYGVVAYVKAVMTYMQIIVDFGFLLSATKDIVNAYTCRDKLNAVVGNTIVAKLFMCLAAFAALVFLMFVLPVLKNYKLYTVLAFLNIVLSVFLLDFLFRGIEKMEIITFRFIIMRGISTVLTFLFVHDDTDILWIPILDILGSLVAVMLVMVEVKKLDIKPRMSSVHDVWINIKNSAVYFASNAASTSFNALNTVIMGALLTTTEVAYWSVCIQIMTAVQAIYDPIINGIYPAMIQRKDLKLIRKISKIFIPLIGLGCIAAFFMAPFGLVILGGKDYIAAAPVFKCLIPVLFFAFPGMLLGWPALGAINKNAEVSRTTIVSVVFQMAGLFILWILGKFNLFTVAILRSFTEMLLCSLRFQYVMKYIKEFQ